MKYTKAEKLSAIDNLSRILKTKDGEKPVIYTILRHVSKSGMTRHIDCLFITNNEPIWLNYDIARACGYSVSKGGSIKISGAGMDMGFHIVYSIAYALTDNEDYKGINHKWL